MPGPFRTLKWLSAAVWLPLFFGPYLRWGERQALLFDMENGRFHLFGATVHPDDIWMLALVLLFFAMLQAGTLRLKALYLVAGLICRAETVLK